VLKELINKRNESSKTFLDDSTKEFKALIYSGPIHWYAKKGRGTNPLIEEWEDIDTDFDENSDHFKTKKP